METIKEMHIKTTVPSTCAVMNWLKENNYPDCDNTFITCVSGQYGGVISNYYPNALLKRGLKTEQAKSYNGMFRWYSCCMWVFYMPEVDKYYYMTL